VSLDPWPPASPDDVDRRRLPAADRIARAGSTDGVWAPVVTVVCFLALVAGVGVVGLVWLGERGCTGEDRSLVEPLAADPMLAEAAAPDGAVADGGVASGPCDEDESWADSARDFSFEGTRIAVVQRYTAQAVSHGWTVVAGRGEETDLCLTKPLRGTSAYLDLTVTPGRGYTVTTYADADSDLGC
jgi:hypothetical protein